VKNFSPENDDFWQARPFGWFLRFSGVKKNPYLASCGVPKTTNLSRSFTIYKRVNSFNRISCFVCCYFDKQNSYKTGFGALEYMAINKIAKIISNIKYYRNQERLCKLCQKRER